MTTTANAMADDPYLDLVEAIKRGAVDGDGQLPRHRLCDQYMIERDTWARMRADLLAQVIADAGSIRRAARVLGVPRSTLGSWIARDR